MQIAKIVRSSFPAEAKSLGDLYFEVREHYEEMNIDYGRFWTEAICILVPAILFVGTLIHGMVDWWLHILAWDPSIQMWGSRVGVVMLLFATMGSVAGIIFASQRCAWPVIARRVAFFGAVCSLISFGYITISAWSALWLVGVGTATAVLAGVVAYTHGLIHHRTFIFVVSGKAEKVRAIEARTDLRPCLVGSIFILTTRLEECQDSMQGLMTFISIHDEDEAKERHADYAHFCHVVESAMNKVVKSVQVGAISATLSEEEAEGWTKVQTDLRAKYFAILKAAEFYQDHPEMAAEVAQALDKRTRLLPAPTQNPAP